MKPVVSSKDYGLLGCMEVYILNKKRITLPAKYEAGFLKDFDRRTELFQLLNGSYQDVITDLGGVDGLSHVQVCLAERFVFLEFVLRRIEARIATEPKKAAKFIGRWIQALNSIVGLAKTIGLERRAKTITSLQTYVKGYKG